MGSVYSCQPANESIIGGATANGSPCGADGACPVVGGTPLVCIRGYCVARSCQLGAMGCPCYANNTCDLSGGIPMSCLDQVCRPTTVPAAGTLNGPCLEDGRCTSSASLNLECVRGRCEERGCPSGQVGCACGGFGHCLTQGTRSPACWQGRCAFRDCTAGTLGCTCGAEGRCGEELTCRSGVCARTAGLGLRLDGEARSCQVLLEGLGGVEAQVTWGESVRGQHVQRGDRLALAFMIDRDGRLPASPARVAPGDPSARPRVVSSECFDGLGRRSPSATVGVAP